MALRCVYTDLDGTLLGRRARCSRRRRNFSLRQARALEACHRAGVEVVIMSGRREAAGEVRRPPDRQTSYIYEAGCGGGDRRRADPLTGDWATDDDGHAGRADARRRDPRPAVRALSGRLEWHAPGTRTASSRTCFAAVEVAEANALLEEHGHEDLRFLDNGSISRGMEGLEGPAHAYHLVPGGASKAKGVAFHLRARGYDAGRVHRRRGLAGGRRVGRIRRALLRGRERPRARRRVREAISRFPNVTVTEGRMGDGFYEAGPDPGRATLGASAGKGHALAPGITPG